MQSGQLSSLPENIFNPLTNLETLNLDGAGLSSLPASIFNPLTNLETLNLKGNYLHPLPASIFNRLISLQELDLEESDLSSLPATIFNSLTNLQTLNLQWNYLSSLPAGIFNSLTNLQTLNLTNSTGINFFTFTPNPLELPSDIFNPLTSLQVLDLSFTGLTTLPSGIFANNTMLRELSLQSVELTQIEEDVFSTLSRLTELNLNGNDLTALPSGIFSGITMLEVLKLENNHLTEIEPNTFNGLTRLRTLEILSQCDASDPTDCNINFFSAGLRLYNSTGEEPLSNNAINIDASTSASESYSIVLLSPPTSDVRIDLSSSDETVASVPESLTIANYMRDLIGWNIPQPVRVVAQQSNGIATISHTIDTIDTADTGYSALTVDDVRVTVIGRDNPEVLVTNADDRETSEDLDGATFQLRLATEPTAAVTVTPRSSDTSEGLVSGPFIFTTENWSTAQNVTLIGEDDRLADGDQLFSIIFTITSDDTTGYADITLAPLLFINRDNEGDPMFTVTGAENLETSEAGGTATFQMSLATQPTAAVTVTLSSSDTTEGAVSSPLTFTPSDWGTAQSVTVTGVDDRQADGDQPYQVTFSVSSSDENYNRIVVIPLLFINKDDEESSSLLVTDAEDLETSEAGGTDSFQMRLSTEPTAAVTVTPSSEDTSEGAVSGPLTFTPSNWDTAQSVTVTGVDDAELDGDPTYQITFSVSSSDENYNDFQVPPVSVTNRDNDPGLVLTMAQNRETLETSEAGGTDSFQMRLATEPAAAVTVTPTSSDATEGAVSGPPLTFTPSDWGTAQTITVTGVDDDEVDDDQFYRITFSVSSSDANYNDFQAPGLPAINRDDGNDEASAMRETERKAAQEAVDTSLPDLGQTVAGQVLDTIQGRFQGRFLSSPQFNVAGQSMVGTSLDEHLLAWATGRGVVTEQQLVEGTSLDLTLAPGNGVAPGLSLWAMGDLAQFDRENDGLSMDGNVTTLLAGGDWGREQWSAGAALARSWSSSSYRSGQQEGESEVNLTTLLPYGHYEVNPQLSVWGMVGYGWGNLSITPDGREVMETDMNLSMAAVGLEGLLLDGGRDGLSLSSIADVLLVNVSSEESNDLDETQSDVSRLRLGLQASRSFPLEDEASLAPMVELALRRDGKDDEADFGLDLSVGLDWSDPRQGTHAGLEGRVLLYHAEEGFHTSGITASLEWDPTPATDRGASLSLKHGVGAATGGGVDALLSSANLPDPASTANSREQQFQALLGYGFAPWGEEGLSITPEIGLGLSSRGREYSLSWSTSPYVQPGEESAWEVSTTVKRQENNNSHPAHSLDLRFSLTL